MDLAYMPDCVSYLALRRLQEQSWVDINKIPAENRNKNKAAQEPRKDSSNCSICKEQKKKKLSNYIRNKLRRDSEHSQCLRECDEDSASLASSTSSNTTRVSGWGKTRTTSE